MDVYFDGLATCLPIDDDVEATWDVEPAEIAKGRGPAKLRVASAASAMDMSAKAARKSVQTSSAAARNISHLMHATTFHQGQDLAPVASYIASEAGLSHASAFEIKQMSNGLAAAVEIAVCLLAGARADAVLVSAGERYCRPGIDRWRTDPGTPYGDGAAAMTISREPGPYKLLSVALAADNSLEGMHRSNELSDQSPGSAFPISFSRSKDRFMSGRDMSSVVKAVMEGQQEAVEDACRRAKVTRDDIKHFALPHFGKRRLWSAFAEGLGVPADSIDAVPSPVGHLGAADQIVGLARLMHSPTIRTGDLVCVITVGAGYTWGAMILRSEGSRRNDRKDTSHKS